jgi:hypothetical protein
MRNPMNSWDKSDSYWDTFGRFYHIGENDLSLMKRLYKAGTEHRKYLRQIMVSMDITAPLYWWKDFDTYKVGTVANSCSTMHKIHAKEFVVDDFSHEHLLEDGMSLLKRTIDELNSWRYIYLNGAAWCNPKDKRVWWQMIQLLPTSYNQRRTLTMNYENVVTIIRQRSGHKLDEFNQLVEILKELPYVKEIAEIE